MLRAGLVSPAKSSAITELLIGIEAARSGGTLRPQVAGIVNDGGSGLIVIAGAPAVGQKGVKHSLVAGNAHRVGSKVQGPARDQRRIVPQGGLFHVGKTV